MVLSIISSVTGNAPSNSQADILSLPLPCRDIGHGGTGELEPLQRYQGHTDAVGDVSWHESNDAVFASVADDKMLFL